MTVEKEIKLIRFEIAFLLGLTMLISFCTLQLIASSNYMQGAILSLGAVMMVADLMHTYKRYKNLTNLTVKQINALNGKRK